MNVFAQIAARDLGDSIRNYQTGSSTEFIVFVIAFLCVVLIALCAWWFVHRRRERRRPLLLFYDLAEYHGMPRGDQKRLLQFAHAHGVEDPARLFVCPELVERIESLEMSEAGSEKEGRRIEGFFGGFRKLAFGGIAYAGSPSGGEA